MASLNMSGPYTLDESTINKFVEEERIGNYALGFSKDGSFYVKYVGRSDEDLNKRLKQHIGKHFQFKFSYALSAKTAFEKECHNYHDFGGNNQLENEIHPDRPKNTNWECPVCTIFD